MICLLIAPVPVNCFPFIIFFANFMITSRIMKMLYLHILQADSIELGNAVIKLILLNDNNEKKSKRFVWDISKILPEAFGILLKVIEKQ